MSAENEAYAEGTRLQRELGAFRDEVMNVNASDTHCKERVLVLIEESREKLRAALRELSGLV